MIDSVWEKVKDLKPANRKVWSPERLNFSTEEKLTIAELWCAGYGLRIIADAIGRGHFMNIKRHLQRMEKEKFFNFKYNERTMDKP